MGNFAKVLLATAKRNVPGTPLKAGEQVAIKVIKKPSSRRSTDRIEMLRAEVGVRPPVVRLASSVGWVPGAACHATRPLLGR